MIKFCRGSQRYIAKRDDKIFLRMRIKDIAQARVRYGYKRIHVLLRREGWKVNHKAVYTESIAGKGLICVTRERGRE